MSSNNYYLVVIDISKRSVHILNNMKITNEDIYGGVPENIVRFN